MENLSGFKQCFTKDSKDAVNDIVNNCSSDILSKFGYGDIFNYIMHSYKLDTDITIHKKNKNKAFVKPSFFKDIFGDELTLINEDFNWKINSSASVKAIGPIIANNCIKFSEEKYDFKKLEGNTSDIMPLLEAAINLDPTNSKGHNYSGMLSFAI